MAFGFHDTLLDIGYSNLACNQTLPLTDYYEKKSFTSSIKYFARCKKCHLRYGVCPTSRTRLKYQTPELRAKAEFQNRLKTKYGISIEDYNKMVEEQKNKCAICLSELNPPLVDHCHQTNKVRGLLCQSCNSGLGFFYDEIKYLRSAIEYLKK